MSDSEHKLIDYLNYDGLKRLVENLMGFFATITHKHTKSDISDFPTKISEFDNDAEYVSAKQYSSIEIYENPTEIPIKSNVQIIYYASTACIVTIKIADKEYSHRLESGEEAEWLVWAQTTENAGSLIKQGQRMYFNAIGVPESFQIDVTTDTESANVAYIFILIK